MTNNVRKKISIFLCMFLVLSAFAPVFGATMDYDTHWAKAEIEAAMLSGVSKGYPDGSFKPDKSITRAEFFSLVNNSFGFTTISTASYSDVSNDAWYAPVIAKAQAAGYISGYPDGSIHPNGNITREEAATIVSRIKLLTAKSDSLTFSDASSIASWSKLAIIAVFEAKIMSGYPDGSFKPQAQLKRAEALVTVNNTFKFAGPIKPTDIVYDKAGTYGSATETVTIEGSVFIKAAGVTLQNTIIKGNLTIAKEVGNGDVTLKSVVVQGNTYVNGGGQNSIYFVDVTTGKVYVLKDDGPVRIVVSGRSAIKELFAGSDVKLEKSNLTGVGFQAITVEKTAGGGIDITLVGINCDSVTILAEGVTLNVDASSVVGVLRVDAKNTTMKGTGVITTAYINAGGVTFEKSPTTIVTAPGVAAPTITPPVVTPPPVTGGGGTTDPVLSSAKVMTAFSFAATPGTITSTAIGTISGTAIAVTVPYGTNVTALVATFTNSDLSTVTVNGVTQISGTTPNNFSAPLSYLVTAENGTIATYTVTVTVTPISTAKAITAFSFQATPGTITSTAIGTISGTAIDVTVPYGTTTGAIVATFTNSEFSVVTVGGVVQVSGTTPNNFASPVTYLVTAQDGTTATYTVTVTVTPISSAKAITAFSLATTTGSAIGTISGTAISVTVPFGTTPSALVATFTSSEFSVVTVSAVVQVSGTTANDFTSPVTYLVTAQDGTTATYTVTVTVEIAMSEKNLIAILARDKVIST